MVHTPCESQAAQYTNYPPKHPEPSQRYNNRHTVQRDSSCQDCHRHGKYHMALSSDISQSFPPEDFFLLLCNLGIELITNMDGEIAAHLLDQVQQLGINDVNPPGGSRFGDHIMGDFQLFFKLVCL